MISAFLYYSMYPLSGAGTILHPHKCKERPRLSQLLTNVPKYPMDSTDSDAKQVLVIVIFLI
jgi:hypothetical protein